MVYIVDDAEDYVRGQSYTPTHKSRFELKILPVQLMIGMLIAQLLIDVL